MSDLRFDDATIRGIGNLLTLKASSMGTTTQVHLNCDLGDETLNGLLAEVRACINDGAIGAQTEAFALGQVAVDAANAWTEADRI